MKTLKVNCPNSPTGFHQSTVNHTNFETCVFCGLQKQNPVEDLQPVYFFDSIGRFSSKRDIALAMEAQKSNLVRDWGWHELR